MKRFSKNHVKVMNTYSNINNQNKINKNQNQNLKLKSNDLQNNYLKNDNQSQGAHQETRNFETLSNNYKFSNEDLYNMNEISPSYKSTLTEYDSIFSSEGRYYHKNNFNNKLFLQTPKNLFKRTENIVNKKIENKNVANDKALSDNKIIKISNNNKNNNNLAIIINDSMNNNIKNSNNSINNNIANKNFDKNKIINKEANIKEVGKDSKVNLDENYNITSSNIDKNNYNNNKFHNIIYSNINDNTKDNYSFNKKNSNINNINNSNNNNNDTNNTNNTNYNNNINNDNNNNNTNNANYNNNIYDNSNTNNNNNTNNNYNNEYYKNSLKNNINNENNINNNKFENNENNNDDYNNDLLNYNNYDDFNNLDNNYNNEFYSDNNIINYDINNNEYDNNEEYYNYDYDYNNNYNINNNIDNNDYANNNNYTDYSNNKTNNNEYFNTSKYNNVNINDNNYEYNRKESLQNDANNDFENDISNNYNYKYNNTDIGNNISNNNQNNLNINNDYMNNTSQNNNKNLNSNNFSYNCNLNKNEDSTKKVLNIITDFNYTMGNNKKYNERNSNRIKKYCQTNIKKSSFKEFKNILKKHRKNIIKDHNPISEANISYKNSHKNSFITDANKAPDFSQSDKNNINIRINNNLGRPLYVKRRHKKEERTKINSEKKLVEQYKENKDSNFRASNYIYKSPELKTNIINDYSQNKSQSTNKKENKYFLNKFNSYNNINFLSVNVSNKKEEFQTPKTNEKIISIRNRRKDIKSMPRMKEYNSFNYSDKNTFRIYNSSKTNTFVTTSSKITDRYIDSYNYKSNIDTGRRNVKPGYKITKRNNDEFKNTIKIVSFSQRKSTHNTHHSEIKITSSFSPNKSSFCNNTSDFNNIKITNSFSPNQNNNTNSNNEIKNSIKLNETFSPNLKRKRPGNRLNSGLTIISCFSQSNKNDNKYTNKIRINKMITIRNNLNQNQLINNKTNNIVINHNIKLTNINKKTSEKQTEIDKFNKYINFGKSLLSKISKKKCDKCNKLIDSHLFKIHYNSHPTEIFNWLYLGTFANACDINELRRMKINYILNVANECNNKNLPRDIKELHLNIKDNEKFEILSYFDEANEFINKCKSEGGILLVHCKLGISRSASFILAYLIKYHKLTLESALEFVKQKRNQIKPNEGFMKQLYEYEKIIKI